MSASNPTTRFDIQHMISLYQANQDADLLVYLDKAPEHTMPMRAVRSLFFGCVHYRQGKVRHAHRYWSSVDPEYYEGVLSLFQPEQALRMAFARYVYGYTGDEQTSNRVLLVASPKSGSSFIENILAKVLNRTRTSISPARGDQWAFDLHELISGISNEEILKTHDKNSPRLRSFINLFNLRPVIITRNIFDSIISFRYHIQDNKPPIQNPKLSAEDAIWLTACWAAAKYVDFFATWTKTSRTNEKILMLAYEENKKDWVGATEKICRHIFGRADRIAIEKAVADIEERKTSEPHAVRFRKGGSYQAESLDQSIVEYVRKLYLRYPDVDFSPIDPGWRDYA